MNHTRVDILMATDLRFPGGNNASVVEELRAQGRAGYTTALLHLPSPVQRSERGYAPRIRALIDDGAASLVLNGSVRASVLIIRHPTVLMDLPAELPLLDVDKVVIVANQVPVDDRARAPYYDVLACDRAARALTGKTPQWAPIGPHVRTALAPFAGRINLRETNWNNIIDVDSWQVHRDSFVAAPPVIGRHSRGDWSKWPADRETLTAIYPTDGAYTVKVLGGTEAPMEILGGLPANWIDLPFNSVPPREYLAGIDFLVYYHHPGLIEAFGRTVLEGIAAGAVAIVDPSFENTFGPAAVYARPAQVRATLDRFGADIAAYLAQSERGVRYVREHFSYATHVERIHALIGAGSAGTGRGEVPESGTGRGEAPESGTGAHRRAKLRIILDLQGEFDAWEQVDFPAIALVPRSASVPPGVPVELIPDHVLARGGLMPAYVRSRIAGLSAVFGDAIVLDVGGRFPSSLGGAHRDLFADSSTHAGAETGRGHGSKVSPDEASSVPPGEASNGPTSAGPSDIGAPGSLNLRGWTTAARSAPEKQLGQRRAAKFAGLLRQRAPQWFVNFGSAAKSAPRKARRKILDALAPSGAVLVKSGKVPRLRAPGHGYAVFAVAGSVESAPATCRRIRERAAMSNAFTPVLLAPRAWQGSAEQFEIPMETLLTQPEVEELGGSWSNYLRTRTEETIELFQPISAAYLGSGGNLDDVVAELDIAEHLGSRRSEKEG